MYLVHELSLVAMSTLAHNGGDNRQLLLTTRFVVVMFFNGKNICDTTNATFSFTIVFLPVFLILHRHAKSTRTLESHCVRLLFCAPAGLGGGVQVMMDLCYGGLCLQTGEPELLIAG